jgi:hypothetical protein
MYDNGMSSRAASARCMPATTRPAVPLFSRRFSCMIMACHRGDLGAVHAHEPEAGGRKRRNSYHSRRFSCITSACRRHGSAPKTGRPHSGACRGTRTLWTHDQINSQAPLFERMVYNRDHAAGQMTVASVPGDTIPECREDSQKPFIGNFFRSSDRGIVMR